MEIKNGLKTPKFSVELSEYEDTKEFLSGVLKTYKTQVNHAKNITDECERPIENARQMIREIDNILTILGKRLDILIHSTQIHNHRLGRCLICSNTFKTPEIKAVELALEGDDGETIFRKNLFYVCEECGDVLAEREVSDFEFRVIPVEKNL